MPLTRDRLTDPQYKADEAEARCQAAAPDLLAALVDLLEAVDTLTENTPPLDMPPFALSLVARARAAIAKSEQVTS